MCNKKYTKEKKLAKAFKRVSCKINFKPQSVTTNFLLHSGSNIIKLIFPNKTKATII